MGRLDKVFDKILAAKSDNNIKFKDLCALLNKIGFESRVKGSHHIFYKQGLDDIINIQELDGHSKAYQVKQIRELILKYKLEIQK